MVILHVLLGDDAYPLKSYLMGPYSKQNVALLLLLIINFDNDEDQWNLLWELWQQSGDFLIKSIETSG